MIQYIRRFFAAERRTKKMHSVKKAFAAVIAVFTVFAFLSCGEKKPVDTFDALMSSVKATDAAGTLECVSDQAGKDYASLISSADGETLDAVKRLYSYVNYTVLSENVEADEAEGKVVVTDTDHCTVRVKISYPDFGTVMSMTESEQKIFPSPKARIIESLFFDAAMSQYIVEGTFDVMLEKSDGEWKIALLGAENREFYDALKITEFLRWILK